MSGAPMRLVIVSALLAAVVGWQPTPVAAQLPRQDVSHLLIPPGGAIAPPALTGETEVWVTLVEPSLAEASGRNAKRAGALLSRSQQRDYSRQLESRQDALMAQVGALGGREIARVRKAHNAVAVRIDASRLKEVAALPGVRAVRPVRNYTIDLGSTVPYIGAAAVQAAGLDGTGVRVAVLDSGIDYTHRNLGGAGTAADYTAAYGTGPADPRNTSRDGLFPTAKVVDGFDYVGEGWPNTALAPDYDPIDFEGHGTHVADIIAGRSVDNAHKGVAPGASLLAVKVCSSVSTACSGIALLQGMDFALDPNGDFDLSDAVDVINMSLGSPYGQQEDDLSQASAIAVSFGVVVVAAAGNEADRPYIVSSPSIGDGVISVAQTQVPTAVAIPLVINAPAAIAGSYANTATLSFAPISGTVTGTVAYIGRGCPADSISPGSPADPLQADPAGKIALIDRGACAISLKVERAALSGATGVLIGLVAAGDAVTFAFGGGTTFVPSLVITQATANLIKANLAAPVVATFSNSVTVPLVSSMVGSSARGPSFSLNAIKPDIGAPGASVSAIAGSGTGEEAFGGTSGATPMISGAAALLLQADGNSSPAEIKARLMNTAETNVFTNPALLPGVLAPITRIGAGEVRVDRAHAGTTLAWDADTEAASLSFGYEAVAQAQQLTRRLVVTNRGNRTRTYSVAAAFRYASDEASGAVAVGVPSTVRVPAGQQRTLRVTLQIDPARLPTWLLNGGSRGGNGSLLASVEFDGYLTIGDATENIHVPWHVLPHKAAAVTPSSDKVKLVGGTGTVSLANRGAVAGGVEVFSLTGTSSRIPRNQLPGPGDNFAIIDLRAVGARLVDAGAGQFAIQFGVATSAPRSHPNYPAEFDIYVDSNNDGVDDYVVYNSENGGIGATGQNVVTVVNLTTGAAVTRFFADADLDSGNFVATALLSDLGLASYSTPFRYSVYAFDNYFTGALTDFVENMVYTPGWPRFFGELGVSPVPVNGTTPLTVSEINGGAAASPSQSGLLLLYRDAQPGKESSLITVKSK
jgi:minor extracellular serine protease Vpr